MEESVVEVNPPSEGFQAIHRWLETFAMAVRERDFVAGRALCVGDVFSFGTVADCARGLDELESDQWQRVWGITTGFAFNLDSACWGGDGETFWVAVFWSSRGEHKLDGEFERRGRATIILRKFGGSLLAVHTHFSLVPGKSEGTTS